MKKLGLKRLLLISVIVLVGISVAVSNYISYVQKKSVHIDTISNSTSEYVASKAQMVEIYLNEKVEGVRSLGELYKEKEFIGNNDEEYIEFTKVLARALNTGSSFIGFDKTGEAFWNLTSSAWPNHKLNGDVREKGYYRDGRKALTPAVTDPYQSDGEESIYYISIVQKTKSGVIGADMKLGFLNEIAEKSTDLPGSVAFIFSEDTTVLASTSDKISVGEKASEFNWLENAALQAVRSEVAVSEYLLNGQESLLFSHRINIANKNWYFAIGLNKSVAFASLNSIKYSSIITAVVAMLVSVILAFLLVQVLYRPILSLKKTVDGLASGNGDLTQRIKVNSNDELGEIAKGINAFISSLQRMMLKIHEDSEILSKSVNQVKEQSGSNALILKRHLEETEHIATAICEMNSTANAMASNALHTASITQQANETSSTSRQIVNQSQKTVSALLENVELSASNVQQMSNETQGINTVLNVIGDIAEQTNLLALNAAIEAARAGDQGRGFAVVADEVRNLASRTKDSTEVIEVALTKLLNGTDDVVESMKSTRKRCEETVSGAEAVTSSLGTMANYISEIDELSSQIATAAEEQRCVTEELSTNMAAINDIVVELERSGNESLNGMENIASVNTRLVEIVNQFKL